MSRQGASVSTLDATTSLQLSVAFTTEHSTDLFLGLVIKVCLPIAIAALLPYAFLLIGGILESPLTPRSFEPSLRHRAARLVVLALARFRTYIATVDQYALYHPTLHGSSPIKRRTECGGATTVLAAGCLVTLAITLTLEFRFNNALISTSLLPAALPVHTEFAKTAPQRVAGLPSIAPASILSGVELRVSTLGANCGSTLAAASTNLLTGTFEHSLVSADIATGRYDHAFTCAGCAFGPQSALSVSFPVSCQAFIFAATSVGSTGSVYVAVTTALNPAASDSAAAPTLVAVNVTLQPQLEVRGGRSCAKDGRYRSCSLCKQASRPRPPTPSPPQVLRVRLRDAQLAVLD